MPGQLQYYLMLMSLSKQSWEMQGGDVAFSHLYLNLLAEVEDDDS